MPTVPRPWPFSWTAPKSKFSAGNHVKRVVHVIEFRLGEVESKAGFWALTFVPHPRRLMVASASSVAEAGRAGTARRPELGGLARGLGRLWSSACFGDATPAPLGPVLADLTKSGNLDHTSRVTLSARDPSVRASSCAPARPRAAGSWCPRGRSRRHGGSAGR